MLSVIIPTFNEAPTLEQLTKQLLEAGKATRQEIELVFVDDGSTDSSWNEILRLSHVHREVCGIRFRRNFGKAAALSAGIEHSRGEIVVTIDADLQDDPAEIPNLLAKMAEGFDVVSGWKKERKDPWHKRWPSLAFNWLANFVSGLRLHDHNCGLKAYRREVLDEISLYGEMHRFMPILAASRGYRISEVVVTHRPREHGYSKYGVNRFVKGLLDLITVCFLTSYRQRPQHLLGGCGMLSFAFGVISLSGLCLVWVVDRLGDVESPIHLHQRALFYVAILAILLGVQMLSMGVIAELLIASSAWNQGANFSIAERANLDSLERTSDDTPERVR